MPPGVEMTETELRDHAEDSLSAVVHEMSIAQTSEGQSRRWQGRAPPGRWQVSGGLHADDRIGHEFTFSSVLAECRAQRYRIAQLRTPSAKKRATSWAYSAVVE